MKRLFRYTSYLLVLLLVSVTSCKKEPINRNIEGHWILENFTILETDSMVTCERIFWGITRVGVRLSEKQGPHGYASIDALLHYGESETKLILTSLIVDHTNEKATLEEMFPYGINNQEETVFQVLKSTRKKMTLQSDYARLEFSKF